MAINKKDHLNGAASHVGYEWQSLADYAAELDKVEGSRTALETAVLEAALVHARCLIGFLCGDYKGRWGANDIRPADFLVEPWSLSEVDDRELRGYLPIINKHLAHLSWERLSGEMIVLPLGLLAHLVSWQMAAFAREAARQGASCAAMFEGTAQAVAARLPPRRRWSSTPITPAPAR